MKHKTQTFLSILFSSIFFNQQRKKGERKTRTEIRPPNKQDQTEQTGKQVKQNQTELADTKNGPNRTKQRRA